MESNKKIAKRMLKNIDLLTTQIDEILYVEIKGQILEDFGKLTYLCDCGEEIEHRCKACHDKFCEIQKTTRKTDEHLKCLMFQHFFRMACKEAVKLASRENNCYEFMRQCFRILNIKMMNEQCERYN